MSDFDQGVDTEPEEIEGDYNASSITIKEEATHAWEVAATVADTYDKPYAWVKRSLEAYELANAPFSHFIDKYCKGEPLPAIEEVMVISREIQRNLRGG